MLMNKRRLGQQTSPFFDLPAWLVRTADLYFWSSSSYGERAGYTTVKN